MENVADDLETILKTKAVEVGLDLLLKRVSEAFRNRPVWRRPHARRVVGTVGSKLDDLVLDLQPCFAMGEQTSALQVFYGSGPIRDESWNRVHEVLTVLGAWFREWDSMRQVIGTRRTPEVLIRQFESLNVILTLLGVFVGPEMAKRFAGLPLDHYAFVSYRALADRYNGFLTNYEGLLRRLPQEVGIEPPPLGGERFFIRL